MEGETERESAVPYFHGEITEFVSSMQDIEKILTDPDKDKISSVPPSKPLENTCYVFPISGGGKWWWRCDQYRWRNEKSYQIANTKLEKTYFKAATKDCPKGDSRFVRFEYRLTENGSDFVMVHYEGECRIGESNPHGNCKKILRPFHRNAPMVREKAKRIGLITSKTSSPRRLVKRSGPSVSGSTPVGTIESNSDHQDPSDASPIPKSPRMRSRLSQTSAVGSEKDYWATKTRVQKLKQRMIENELRLQEEKATAINKFTSAIDEFRRYVAERRMTTRGMDVNTVPVDIPPGMEGLVGELMN